MSEPVTWTDSSGQHGASVTQFATASVCADTDSRELSIVWTGETSPAEWQQIREHLAQLGDVQLGPWFYVRDTDGGLFYGQDGRY
jgi:hypothetical protein